MIEYTIVGLFCVLLAGAQKNIKYALECSFVCLTFFLAVRYEFGSDYPEYLRHFYIANSGSLSDALATERLEDGWVILCRLLKPIGFFGMIILLTVFEHFVLYRLIKRHVPPSYYWLAVFSYVFSVLLCLTGVSMMRQFLAMCICLISFDLALNKKNVVWAVLLVLLASTFHTSALLCIPICFAGFLKDIRLSNRGIVVASIFAAIVVILFIRVLGDYLYGFVEGSVFSTYGERFEEEGGGAQIGISTFINYFFLFLILFYQKRQDYANRRFVLFFVLYFLIQPFNSFAPLIGRIGLYFYLLFPVCFSNAVAKIKVQYARFFILSLFIAFQLYTCYSFVTSPGWGNSFLEYRTIFSVDQWQ